MRAQCTLFSSTVNETCIFSTNFRKIFKFEISRESAEWEPRFSMRTDRQTHMMKLIIALRNFASEPKNVCLSITGQSIYVIIMIQNET
jgi:hypothetical protein